MQNCKKVRRRNLRYRRVRVGKLIKTIKTNNTNIMRKAYKFKKGLRSTMPSAEVVEGETIENKIVRIVQNKEPITDGAPEIFTERKDGVISAYNIRTDRWEIAAEAMDKVAASIQAKRDGLPKPEENNDANNVQDSGAEPTQGESQGDNNK